MPESFGNRRLVLWFVGYLCLWGKNELNNVTTPVLKKYRAFRSYQCSVKSKKLKTKWRKMISSKKYEKGRCLITSTKHYHMCEVNLLKLYAFLH